MHPTEPSSDSKVSMKTGRQPLTLWHLHLLNLTSIRRRTTSRLLFFNSVCPAPTPLSLCHYFCLPVSSSSFLLSLSACGRSQLVTDPSLGFVSDGNRRSGKGRQLGEEDKMQQKVKGGITWDGKRERELHSEESVWYWFPDLPSTCYLSHFLSTASYLPPCLTEL